MNLIRLVSFIASFSVLNSHIHVVYVSITFTKVRFNPLSFHIKIVMLKGKAFVLFQQPQAYKNSVYKIYIH